MKSFEDLKQFREENYDGRFLEFLTVAKSSQMLLKLDIFEGKLSQKLG